MSLNKSTNRLEPDSGIQNEMGEQGTDSAGRFLTLTGAGNVRDLGGLPTDDGRRTRSGLILRSDFLVKLSQEDEVELLQRFGLRTVIDLRTRDEIEAHPGPWEGRGPTVVRTSLPIDPDFAATSSEEMVGLYLSFLEPPAEAMKAALSVLLDPDAHPLLIHCAAGKDRTGVLVALALILAGVKRSAVIDDYTLTHARMPAVVARLVAEADRPPLQKPATMYGADRRTVESFLRRLEGSVGSVREWALAQGIQPVEINRFQAAFLSDQMIG